MTKHVVWLACVLVACVDTDINPTAEQSAAVALPASPLGEQRTVVFLVNYRNDTSEPITVEQARALVFGQIGDFYREGSYGQTYLSGDVFGWLTLDQDAGCTNCGGDDPLKAAVTASGANLASYSRILVLRPALAPYSWSSGISACALSTTGQTCADSYSLNPSVIAHELGHNFGLPHAGGLDCGEASLGICVDQEYVDQFDTMGVGKPWLGHFNAILKQKMGWLGTASAPPVQTVTTSGTYTIAPLEAMTASLPRALTIQKDVDPTTGTPIVYSIELRAPLGFDSFLAQPPFTNRPVVLLRLYSASAANTKVVQTRPRNPETGQGGSQFAPDLIVGEPFIDRDSGIVIEVVSATTEQANIRVSFGRPPVVMASASASIVAPGTSVVVSANATSSEAPIAAVEVRHDDTVLCTDTTAPYACTVTAPATVDTIHDLKVSAIDTRGLRASRTVRVSTDATSPVFSVLTPLEGATVSAGANLNIQTFGENDNVKISHKEIRINGTKICRATTLNCGWMVPAYLTNATFTIAITVFDTSGNSTTRTVTVKTGAGGAAAFIAPSATMVAPSDGATVTAYSRTASIRPAAQITSVQSGRAVFYADGRELGSANGDATGLARLGSLVAPIFVALPPGRTVQLAVKPVDVSAIEGPTSTEISVHVVTSTSTPAPDLVAPSVTFTSPTNGALVPRGSVQTMTATATDNVRIERVEFSINGNLTCTDTTAPYSCSWTVSKGRSRTFTLQARAFDAAGNTSAAAISVHN